jgi:hypothetical protein
MLGLKVMDIKERAMQVSLKNEKRKGEPFIVMLI